MTATAERTPGDSVTITYAPHTVIPEIYTIRMYTDEAVSLFYALGGALGSLVAADLQAQAQAIADACALSQQDVQTVLDAVLESRAKDRLLDKLLRTVHLEADESCFWDDYGHRWDLDEGERAVAKALRPTRP